MLTFVIAALVVILVLFLGAGLAFVFARLDTTVVKTKQNIDEVSKAYKPGMTLGYEVDTTADPQKQVLEARRIAAKQAAALPRGGNMGITRKGVAATKLASASKGVDKDPWTAAKIATFHGWDGAKTGIPAAGAPVAAMPAAAAPAAGGKIVLVPGKDYPVIELTDDMSPDEKRKARIANSKAKSAAMKAAKAAGVTAAPVAAAAPVGAAAVAAPPPVAVDVTPPTIIAITDDMAPDEKRKARIANSKAKSQFNKALKAAGVDPKIVKINDQGEVVWPSGAPPVAAAPVAAAPATAVAAPAPVAPGGAFDLAALGIAPPEITPLNDDMSPDEKRKARINNSKAKSAFNKALKAAGVDPKTVNIDDKGVVTLKEGAAPAAAPAPAAPSAPAPAAPVPDTAVADTGGAVDLAALGIDKPEIIELTDDMSPDEKRQARIANSKAKSAFNKALKAAGVDPKSVKL